MHLRGNRPSCHTLASPRPSRQTTCDEHQTCVTAPCHDCHATCKANVLNGTAMGSYIKDGKTTIDSNGQVYAGLRSKAKNTKQIALQAALALAYTNLHPLWPHTLRRRAHTLHASSCIQQVTRKAEQRGGMEHSSTHCPDLA
jgi:hypothetical protein